MNSLIWWRDCPRNRKVSPKPPQRQCRERGPHGAHLYPGPELLIWSCQGRTREAS